MFTLNRLKIVLLGVLGLLLVMAQRPGLAGSTGIAALNSISTPCAVVMGNTTTIPVSISYNSATDFDYVAYSVSIINVATGTQTGTLPAGNVSNLVLNLTFTTTPTASPWGLHIYIDTSVGGVPQDRVDFWANCDALGYWVNYGGTIDLAPLGSGAGGGQFCAADGRLNHNAAIDCAAPVAVYHTDAGFSIYGVNPTNAQGTLSLLISSTRIEEVGVPDENTLLAEGTIAATGQRVRVYRLASGEYQLNTFYADGKPYIIAWDENGNVRHLAD